MFYSAWYHRKPVLKRGSAAYTIAAAPLVEVDGMPTVLLGGDGARPVTHSPWQPQPATLAEMDAVSAAVAAWAGIPYRPMPGRTAPLN